MVVTLTAAAASVGLLAAALAFGWLGPDVGRGGSFCEEALDAVVKQPANTFSNLGFVVAGLAIAAHVARRGAGTMSASLGTAYAVLVVLLGPGSAAMHASESALGGHLDLYSMYLLASFVLSYAAARLLALPAAGFAGLFVVALGVCTVAEFVSADVPVVMTVGNAVFGVMLLAALGLEALSRRRTTRLDLRWGLASVATLVVAFAIWNTGKDGGVLCDPGSWLQPHAVWHVLDAVAAWLLFRYYASGGGGSDGDG
ncbi:ceramidase domain-containing protein [Knoellia locipacati]|uniref:ceramidase domain-containing protein n=1 Tax=Knoellia locipacati TaxID=882824 RepID=UPI00384C8B71